LGGCFVAEDDEACAGVGEGVVFEVLVVFHLAELGDESEDLARVADVGGSWCDAQVDGAIRR
jgi:hypothetical protein